MHRRKIESLREEKIKCEWRENRINLAFSSIKSQFKTGSDDFKSKYAGDCRAEPLECPAVCHCERSTVDCSGRGLKEIPRDIPLYATEL